MDFPYTAATDSGNDTAPTRPARSITRHLLLPADEQALTLSLLIQARSREWLRCNPPLEILPPGEQEESDIVAALQRQADVGQAQELFQAGLQIRARDEMALWIILSLPASPVPRQEGAPGGAGNVNDRSGALRSLIEQARRSAWLELRTRISVGLLFLAPPSAQSEIARLNLALGQVCDRPSLVLSPVNFHHQHLGAERWQERSATTVAALLWADMPSHSQQLHNPAEKSVWACGAACWPAPRNELGRYLRAMWRVWFANRLLEKPGKQPMGKGPNNLELPLEQELLQELHDRIPAPQSAAPPYGVHPAWQGLESYGQEVAHRAEQEWEKGRRLRQQRRGEWTAQSIERFSADWDAFLASLLSPGEGWPKLPSGLEGMHALSSQLLARAAAADSYLEEKSGQLAAAQEWCAQALTQLEELCRSLPRPSLREASVALAQPWRWAGWLYAYWVELPEKSRQLREAWAERNRAMWQEECHHCLRQLYLLLYQEGQERVGRLERLEARIEALRAEGQGQVGMAALDQLTPWSAEQCGWLYNHCLGDGNEAGLAFLQSNPLGAWQDYPIESLRDRMDEALRPWLTALERWEALDLLCAALPKNEMTRWLERQEQAALPQWPEQESSASQYEERWLTWPAPSQHLSDTDTVHRRTAYEEWRAQQPNTLDTTGCMDGLLLLHWVAVDLSVE